MMLMMLVLIWMVMILTRMMLMMNWMTMKWVLIHDANDDDTHPDGDEMGLDS